MVCQGPGLANENPRIVVPENLENMPQVNVVTREEADQAEPDAQPVLQKTNKLMELSRLPLTYVQDHVPFLTKRKIIFFGRLELDYAQYSSGILADDSGFNLRRFRLGLAGRIRPWPGLIYKIEIDLTDGENTLSDAYISWRSDKWGTFRLGNQKVAQTLSGQISSINLNDLDVEGGTEKNLTFGVNWYSKIHWRFMGNVIKVWSDGPNGEQNPWIGQFRAQYFF